jgi:dihydrofolate reductase
MRKIIVQEMVTVDGFFAGPNGEIDWHVVDAEFQEYAIAMLNSVDTILFGRITYDIMVNFWPTSAAREAERMNNLSKIVFSRSPVQNLWNDTAKVLSEIVPEDFIKMKQEEGKDIVILGSGQIVSAFTQLGLIDEYRLLVNPVVLGKGKSLFVGLNNRPTFKLVSTKTFNSGNVALCYEPVK